MFISKKSAMTNPKKQLKITKLFRKGAVPVTKVPEDCDELQEEIQHLEQKLREKQNELFQIQRNSFRHKIAPLKRKEDCFERPQKLVLSNSVESLQRSFEVMSMLTSTEVQSYVAGESCSIVFHMQHRSEHEMKHGLRIDLRNGANTVSACSLPLGFNIAAVQEDFHNLMKPECLGAIRKALVAYYDRLEQFQALRKLVKIEAELFKTLDGSHMEVSLYVQNQTEEEDEHYKVVLLLDYRVYDIRPKNYSVRELDLPEGMAEVVRNQCAVFKKKPLHKAFKEAFVDGVGPYTLVQQVGPRSPQRRRKRGRPQPQRYNNDDTFHPEECSDDSDEDVQ